MKYAHILMAVAADIWAVEPEKLQAIVGLLALQASGEKYSAEEIEAKIAPQTARAVARREGAVAVIPMQGVIANRMNLMGNVSGGGGTSSEQLTNYLRSAIDDPDVKAIILDCDTPGGNAHGADEASAVIAANRGGKPIIAQVNANLASAGYWIGCSCDEIVMTPSSEVGSIGVYTVHEDISAALEKLGVKRTLIGAGKFKGENQPFQPLSEEALAYTQQRVNAYYDLFVRRVAQGRNVDVDAVRGGFGQGRMVGADDAIRMKMADRIGTMEETLKRFGVNQYGAPRQQAQTSGMSRHQAALVL